MQCVVLCEKPDAHRFRFSFSVVSFCMLVQHVLWSFLSPALWARGSFYSGGKWRLYITGHGAGWGMGTLCLLVILSGSRSKVGQLLHSLRDLSIQLALSRVMIHVCEIWRGGGQFIILGIWLDTQDVYIHPQTGCSVAAGPVGSDHMLVSPIYHFSKSRPAAEANSHVERGLHVVNQKALE